MLRFGFAGLRYYLLLGLGVLLLDCGRLVFCFVLLVCWFRFV